MKNIWLLGADGILGSEICELSPMYTNYDFYFSGLLDSDLSAPGFIETTVIRKDIDVIVVCIERPDKYLNWDDNLYIYKNFSNGVFFNAIKTLCNVCKDLNLKVILISTDEVFDGKQAMPYGEHVAIKPMTFFGKMKSQMEQCLIEANLDNSFLIRSSWLFSTYGNNLLTRLLKKIKENKSLYLEKDKVAAPTHAWELAHFLLENVIKSNQQGLGIYHFANDGICSKYDFGKEVLLNSGLNCKIIPVPANLLDENQHGYYRVLDTEKLKKRFGYEATHWKESLKNCMRVASYYKN